MEDVLRAARCFASNRFRQELKEPRDGDDHIVVRASAKDKEEVQEWAEEFARIAGVSYISAKGIALQSNS
jgi:hypothetical protein